MWWRVSLRALPRGTAIATVFVTGLVVSLPASDAVGIGSPYRPSARLALRRNALFLDVLSCASERAGMLRGCATF